MAIAKSKQASAKHSTKRRSRLKVIAPGLGALALTGVGLYSVDALLRKRSPNGYGLTTGVIGGIHKKARAALEKRSREARGRSGMDKVLEYVEQTASDVWQHSQIVNKAQAKKRQRAQLVKNKLSRWPLVKMTPTNQVFLRNSLRKILEQQEQNKNNRGFLGQRSRNHETIQYERHLQILRDLESKYLV